MTRKGISVRKCHKKKQELYIILIGNDSADFLNWVLVKIAKLGTHFVSSHISSDSGSVLKENPENQSQFYRGVGVGKTVYEIVIKDSISQSLINKVLKRVAKHCTAMEVIVETNRENTLESWVSFLKCCTNWSRATTAILVFKNDMIIPAKCSVLKQRGLRLHSIRSGEELAVENTKSNAWTDDTGDLNNQFFFLHRDCKENFSLRSISLIRRELPESTLGWPLLRRTTQNSKALNRRRERNMSVVEWVMSLPSRSTSVSNQKHVIDLDLSKISFGREIDNSLLNDDTIEEVHSAEEESTDGVRDTKDKNLRTISGSQAEVSSSASVIATNLSLSKPGWPLLRIEASVRFHSSGESEDMTLPNQSTPATPQSLISLVSSNVENSSPREIPYPKHNDDDNYSTPSTKSTRESELLLKLVSSNCKQFSCEELKQATSQFASDNLIGEGGCSNVYKGCLPNGKLVAVKVLKYYKEAWNDFSLEVDITSSLMHKNITPLIGVCIKDNNLILVYDFLPKGSLDEILHGVGKNSALPWEVRFKLAVDIAEALNYLHNECLRPVIHRDVKSSNILLSIDFQPQLSDFGLAIWGPTDSTCLIHEDVVGTFGYIAPEYFMHGKVSEKVDVYSFGVVLLELLSGRKPLGSNNLKGQESLVKWAKPILQSGNPEELLDSYLNHDFDIAEMQRMVLAAKFCISQSPRHRPKVNQVLVIMSAFLSNILTRGNLTNVKEEDKKLKKLQLSETGINVLANKNIDVPALQILKLLRGEKDAKDFVDANIKDAKVAGNQEEDDLLEYGGKPRLDLSILDTDFDATSLSSVDSVLHFSTEQKHRLKLRDYLKIEQD